jgi:pyrroline-5-carboxylate reductase
VVFLAVKPYKMAEVLAGLAEVVTSRHLVISVAAGVRLATVERMLPEARVVRIMPNVAARVSASMTAFVLGKRARRDRALVKKLLSAFGDCIELPENKFDVFTALAGSGPAFLAHCLDRMIAGAVAGGLGKAEALAAGIATLRGTGLLLKELNLEPAALVHMVATPGGTTEAGLRVLDSRPVNERLARTIAKAAERSRQLS